MNGDGLVDLTDFSIFAQQWMFQYEFDMSVSLTSGKVVYNTAELISGSVNIECNFSVDGSLKIVAFDPEASEGDLNVQFEAEYAVTLDGGGNQSVPFNFSVNDEGSYLILAQLTSDQSLLSEQMQPFGVLDSLPAGPNDILYAQTATLDVGTASAS